MENKDRNELIGFLTLAFAIMWLVNLPRVLAEFEIVSIQNWLSPLLGNLAMLSPLIASIVMVIRLEGFKSVGTFLKSGFRTGFEWKWVVLALLLFPVSAGVTILVLGVLGQSIPWENGLPWTMAIPIGLVIWIFGALPEEYGWRGFALPRILKVYDPLTASLVLGVTWALWHLPLHFIDGTTQYVIPFWEYALQTLVLSVIYTWLFLRTKGSILAASLLHAAGNITGALIPYWVLSSGRYISFLLLLAVAIWIVLVEFPKLMGLTSRETE